jgi:diguanylate cyclase (GGDEF)-like protein
MVMQRVLIVEDSKVVQQVLRHLSAQLSVPIDFAWSLREAAGFLKNQSYDVALVDLTLPDAPNGEVAKLTLKQKIPTVVLTSTIDEHKRQQMLEMGVVDYVLKDNRDSYLYAIKLLTQLLANKGCKVLIADDSATSRKIMKHMLEQLLYQVIEAEDGEQALITLKADSDIQLLLTDYAMPKMDGFELVKAIRNERGRDELAIIGISGSGGQSLSARFIKNGANDFLLKPFMQEEFHCRVMQTLEQLKLIAEIKDTANRDYLTNLYNRRYFYNQSEVIIHNLKKQGHDSVVVMVDVDHFKLINDTYGHQAGDDVLIKISAFLQAYFVDHLLARIGGEEFAILLKEMTLEQAFDLVDGCRFKIANELFSYDGQPIGVFVSAGLSSTEAVESPQGQGPDELDELIKMADAALYEAKSQGRNQVVPFQSGFGAGEFDH